MFTSVVLTGAPTHATAKVSPTVIYVEPIGVTTEIDAQRFSRTRTTGIPTADEVPTALPSTWAALTATVVPDHDQDLSDSGLQRERLLLNLYSLGPVLQSILFITGVSYRRILWGEEMELLSSLHLFGLSYTGNYRRDRVYGVHLIGGLHRGEGTLRAAEPGDAEVQS